MFAKTIATAAIALTVAAIAAPAHAGGVWVPNGVQLNGVTLNGESLNGRKSNGRKANGKTQNGWTIEGTEAGATDFTIYALELPPETR